MKSAPLAHAIIRGDSPVCVGVGALVGGIAFAVGVDLTFDWLWQ